MIHVMLLVSAVVFYIEVLSYCHTVKVLNYNETTCNVITTIYAAI